MLVRSFRKAFFQTFIPIRQSLEPFDQEADECPDALREVAGLRVFRHTWYRGFVTFTHTIDGRMEHHDSMGNRDNLNVYRRYLNSRIKY